MAAPTATTSSGLTPLDGFLPKTLVTTSCTAGILVEPPTNIISSISLVYVVLLLMLIYKELLFFLLSRQLIAQI